MTRKRKIPQQTFDNNLLDDVERSYPSLECLTKEENNELESRISNLVGFETRAKTPFQVVNYISKQLFESGFKEENILKDKINSEQNYFFKDPWESGSMVIVKEGEKPISEGFNMILSHSDSPCLRIKPRPIRLEWDPDKIYNFLGIRLSAIAHGGISNYQWVGQQVNIIGYTRNKNGKQIEISFPGVVGDYSAHVDNRGEDDVKNAFAPEKSLEVITGHTSVKDILNKLEFDSQDDFSQTRFLAVPTNNPLEIDEYTWRLLIGYGHDDKACIFSAADAIIKSKKPKYTSLIWITDREEIGDTAPSGAEGPFIDLVLDKLLDKEEEYGGNKISGRERRRMYFNSSLLIGDVNISPYGHDEDNMDYYSSPKIGLGFFITSDNYESSSTEFVRKLKNIARKGISKQKNLCYQMCGLPNNQDQIDLWYGPSGGQYTITKKIGQWAWVGIPCASAHSHNEIICPGDEYWTSKFYKRFFELNKPIGEK